MATNKLEQLLKNNPEEKLILPAMYHLYKIYQITDNAKAESMRINIKRKFPKARNAKWRKIMATDEVSNVGTPNAV